MVICKYNLYQIINYFCRSVVELLVRRGAALTFGERTPLYEASQEGHLDVARFLIQELKKAETREVSNFFLSLFRC